MLNLNKYVRVWTDRFIHGLHFEIESSGTGHWPFILFSYQFLTGPISAWELTVLGLTVGKRKVHDVDPETGALNGPDKDQYYNFFMCLNHKHQSMEDIISSIKSMARHRSKGNRVGIRQGT